MAVISSSLKIAVNTIKPLYKIHKINPQGIAKEFNKLFTFVGAKLAKKSPQHWKKNSRLFDIS